jgi:hypothetical protein
VTNILDNEKAVQGFALYTEFKNAYGHIYQMFITPDGYDEMGAVIPATVYRRRLDEAHPKKQWKTTRLGIQMVDSDGILTEAHKLSRLESIRTTMLRLGASYSIVGKPFFVEVPKKDLSDIRTGKTPIKVVYRIGQTRSALNFPEMFSKVEGV